MTDRRKPESPAERRMGREALIQSPWYVSNYSLHNENSELQGTNQRIGNPNRRVAHLLDFSSPTKADIKRGQEVYIERMEQRYQSLLEVARELDLNLLLTSKKPQSHERYPCWCVYWTGNPEESHELNCDAIRRARAKLAALMKEKS